MFAASIIPRDGVLLIEARVPHNESLTIACNVVLVDIPLLFVLDALPKFSLKDDFKKHRVSPSDPPWSLQRTYRSGHDFMSPECFLRSFGTNWHARTTHVANLNSKLYLAKLRRAQSRQVALINPAFLCFEMVFLASERRP